MGDDNNWLWSTQESIRSDTTEGQRLIKQLLEQLERAQWAPGDLFGIHLAAEEALVNAIKHGNKEDPNKWVHVDIRVGKEKVLIQITDEGPGFNPDDVPDPTLDENLDIPSGRGVMLIKAYMTDVSYNEQGNSVYMEKIKSR